VINRSLDSSVKDEKQIKLTSHSQRFACTVRIAAPYSGTNTGSTVFKPQTAVGIAQLPIKPLSAIKTQVSISMLATHW